jgi:hypothetical protein
MNKLRFVLSLLIFGWGSLSSFGIQDTYERGATSDPFPAVTDEDSEFYRQWLEGTDFVEHHFSPGYSGGDPSPFWDRVDKQAPSPSFVFHSLWANPKHLIWDTPINMGYTVKESWFDTWRQSESGWEIAGDMLVGLPNTAMVGINGIYDSGTNFYTDVWTPVLAGGLVLWPTRLLSNLTRGWEEVYNVVDVVPKTLWAVGLPIRKLGITVADQVQMGGNFVYRSVTHPLTIPDHFDRYWGPRQTISYSPSTYVPVHPRTTPSGTRTELPAVRSSEPSRTYVPPGGPMIESAPTTIAPQSVISSPPENEFIAPPPVPMAPAPAPGGTTTFEGPPPTDPSW